MSNVFQLLGVLPGPLLDQTVHDIHKLECKFNKVRMVNKCPQVFPENSAAFCFSSVFFLWIPWNIVCRFFYAAFPAYRYIFLAT